MASDGCASEISHFPPQIVALSPTALLLLQINPVNISALFPQDKTASAGSYRVVFKTGDFYKKNNQKTFFPEIPVEFNMEASGEHYHIPLLLSPFGYSTYRGN